MYNNNKPTIPASLNWEIQCRYSPATTNSDLIEIYETHLPDQWDHYIIDPATIDCNVDMKLETYDTISLLLH